MFMHRVATVDNPTRTGIILCPVGGITPFTPRIISVAFYYSSSFVGKSYQFSLIISITIIQCLYTVGIDEYSTAAKVMDFLNISKIIGLFFVIAEVIFCFLSYSVDFVLRFTALVIDPIGEDVVFITLGKGFDFLEIGVGVSLLAIHY